MDQGDKKKDNTKQKSPKMLNAYVYYSGLGFQMIAVIGLFTYAGYRLDKGAGGNAILWTAIFSLLGVFFSLYMVIKSVLKRK
ncbi:Putative F0F1-ATPase subunit Ca2+/Mg2+ transporter [bacterium A37T11]|nr:Putative F0F1-ATPase subunit Ca2+/Mg2+ transporter [bacterium A37T11]